MERSVEKKLGIWEYFNSFLFIQSSPASIKLFPVLHLKPIKKLSNCYLRSLFATALTVDSRHKEHAIRGSSLWFSLCISVRPFSQEHWTYYLYSHISHLSILPVGNIIFHQGKWKHDYSNVEAMSEIRIPKFFLNKYIYLLKYFLTEFTFCIKAYMRNHSMDKDIKKTLA
jgi:hypothetical protein